MGLKNRKLFKQKKDTGQGEDRISKLPDSLLHHILSFLKIKCAVGTSILSKRWRTVWVTIPNLDFLEWRSPTTKDIHLETKVFMNFMDRMLLRRGSSNNIQKFALKCDNLLDASRINAWISTVITCNVEMLNLCGSIEEPFFIPLSLFTCGSLTELSLQIHSDFNLSLPKSISFPSLRHLELYCVTFKDEYLTEKLFANCPVLEDLKLNCCTWVNMKIVCVSAPALQFLAIGNCGRTVVDGLEDCEVKIHAPSLRALIYKGIVANAYDLSSFPSLLCAKVDLVFGENYPELGLEETSYGSSATNLLGRLSNVKALMVFNRTLEALSFADNLLNHLPTFHDLIHLYIYSVHKALFLLLQKAPNLKLLIFWKGFPPSAHNENVDNWLMNVVADSLFLHLKEVRFERFCGHTMEMDVVKLILRNARALETIAIMCSPFLSKNLNTKVVVMEKLLSFPRKSEGCVIKFS